MALLKQTMRKAPHTNILQENFQTFIIHDILSSQSQQQQQIISNDNANAIIIDPTTSNTSSTATSTPIYELGKHLLNAAKTGNVNEIKSLMGRGAAFTPDWLGACPLHYAASNGHVQACEVLLKAGISRNSRTKVDRTPLHMAVYEGHIDVVENLIKHGADINAKDMLLMTPLQWAVQRCNHGDNNDNDNRIAMVKCLLDNKAKVRAENKFGNTALDIARQLENIELIELIKNVMAEVGEDDLLTNDDDTKDDEIVVNQQQEHCAVDADEPAAMADRQPYYVDQEEVNEYLNDVVRLSYSSADQQQQVVTIEDCIVAAEDATNTKAAVVAPLLIDNGYCSSTSVDQQAQQPLVDQQHIDLTNDESTSGTIIEQQNNDAVVDDPYRLLRQRYGIELLPELEEDGGRILKQAMDSGHSVSLTEAGKRALKAIKLQVQVQEDPPPSNQEDEHVDQQQQQQLFLSATNGKQLKKQAPLQLVSKGIVQQQKQTIGHKLGGNIINTSKRKRILPYSVTSASNLNKKIVILQNTNSQNTTTVQVASSMIGTARQLHELANTTAPSSGVGNMMIRQGSKQLVRQQKQWQQVVGQQQQQQKQQETTLVTLTADEFAGLQANGGLITTNNGIYRIMDYNNTPVTSVTGVKYKKFRNNNNNKIVGQTGVIVQQQQQQQESDTIKSLKQQLQEQRHLVDIYKRKYLKKEAEAERFKQQLKLMLKDRSSNKDLNSDAIYNNNNNNGNER